MIKNDLTYITNTGIITMWGFDERYTMGAMKDLWEQINYYLDKTKWSCEEIANYLEVPVSWVNEVVEERWNEVINE